MEQLKSDCQEGLFRLEVPLGGLDVGLFRCVSHYDDSMITLVQGHNELAISRELFEQWCSEKDSPFSRC